MKIFSLMMLFFCVALVASAELDSPFKQSIIGTNDTTNPPFEAILPPPGARCR
jgi:hypothetical protein